MLCLFQEHEGKVCYGGRFQQFYNVGRCFFNFQKLGQYGACMYHWYLKQLKWMFYSVYSFFVNKNEIDNFVYSYWINWDWDERNIRKKVALILSRLTNKSILRQITRVQVFSRRDCLRLYDGKWPLSALITRIYEHVICTQ